MRFFSTFGQLPGTWSSLIIIVISGLSEGMGLVLFVPLLEMMTNGSVDDMQWPFTLIVDVFNRLGLTVTLRQRA